MIKLIFTSSKSGKKKFLKVVKDLIRNELDVFLKKKSFLDEQATMSNIMYFKWSKLLGELETVPILMSVLTASMTKTRGESKLMP